jgi:SAM-dependent methyltransferase
VRQLFASLRNIPGEKTIIPDFFTPSLFLPEPFDIVLLSHCTQCFLPDPEPFLLHALAFRNEYGRAIVYQPGLSNFRYRLERHFVEELPKKRFADPVFTGKDVREILEKNRIPHEVTHLPGFLRAGRIFRPGNDRLLSGLIAFSLRVEADSLGPGLRRRVEAQLREIAFPSPDGPRLDLGIDAIVTGPGGC